MRAFLHRLKWVAAFLLVFVLIIGTNLLDRRHFQKMADTVESIYEDRLVAKELIFKMDRVMHEKTLALIQSHNNTLLWNRIERGNDSLLTWWESFEKTQLTKEEERIFRSMTKKMQDLPKRESAFLTHPTDTLKVELEQQYLNIQQDLQQLSRIQIQEGKRKLSDARRTMKSIEFFTNVEIISLVIIGLLLQFLLLYPVKWNKVV